MAKRAQRPAASEPNPAMRRRVIVDAVTPQVDDGRYPARRTVGDDVVAECVLWRPRGAATWRETAMAPLGNDRWRARFTCAKFTDYEFTVEGWVDLRATWREALEKKSAAGQDVSSDTLEGTLIPADGGRSRGTRYEHCLL